MGREREIKKTVKVLSVHGSLSLGSPVLCTMNMQLEK